MIERVPRELTVAAVFGGTPSAAHTEALLRGDRVQGRDARGAARRDRDRHPADDAVSSRASRPNPVSAAYLGLGLALRLWRNAFPVAPGGTAILLHDFARRFPAPTQTPYRALFADARTARDRDALREAERAAIADTRAIGEYRAGRAVHPLEPFVAWSACDAAASRLGHVLVAGCRDAPAARQLGFVPGARRRRGARDGARTRGGADRLPALAAVLPARRRSRASLYGARLQRDEAPAQPRARR